MSEDARLTAAKTHNFDPDDTRATESVMDDLIAFAEERLRVNVGLIAENTEMRKRLLGAQP